MKILLIINRMNKLIIIYMKMWLNKGLTIEIIIFYSVLIRTPLKLSSQFNRTTQDVSLNMKVVQLKSFVSTSLASSE